MDGRLEVLARDGMLSVTFTPRIPAASYGELMELSQMWPTKAELRIYIALFAERWQLEVIIED